MYIGDMKEQMPEGTRVCLTWRKVHHVFGEVSYQNYKVVVVNEYDDDEEYVIPVEDFADRNEWTMMPAPEPQV